MQIRRNTPSLEPPDLDEIGVPFEGIDSAACVSQTLAVGGRVGALLGTALVVALAGGVDEAVAGEDGGGHVLGGRGGGGTAVGGMEGVEVAFLDVDAFDDVDFAVVGPVVAVEPAGGVLVCVHGYMVGDGAKHISRWGESRARYRVRSRLGGGKHTRQAMFRNRAACGRDPRGTTRG